MQRVVYFVVTAGLLLIYYQALGPGPGPSELPEDLEWWRPAGLVHTLEAFAPLERMAEGGLPGAWIPVGLFWLPAIALYAWGLRLFQSAVLRTVATTCFFLLLIFPYYGYVADRIWRFFEWRSVAVAASFAGVTAAGLFAPSLLRAALKLSRVWTGIALLAVFAAVFVFSTEVTGTDYWMRVNLSPWPVLTLFGFLLVGSVIASLHVASGAGFWLASKLGGTQGLLAGAGLAMLVAAALSRATLQSPDLGALAFFGVLGAAYGLARTRLTDEEGEAGMQHALVVVAAGAFSLFAIHASNMAATGFQRTARNVTATKLLVALEDHREKTGSFPRKLEELVPDFFDEVPRPRIGLIRHEDDEFTYRNLGDSYVVEFSSVQWVQCGYSPPFDVAKYEDEDFEDEGEWEDADEWGSFADDGEPAPVKKPVDPDLLLVLADAGLEGSWNCEDAPPKLW